MFKEWLTKILNRRLDRKKQEVTRLRWKKAYLEQIKLKKDGQ